jgi:hypothetical protein
MLWLSEQLADYAKKKAAPSRPLTLKEMNAILDEAEAEIAAGGGIDDDDLWKEDEEEYERELVEEQKLQLEAV